MASIVARGGKVWQVNVRHTEPGGTQRTRWHTLPETVKNKKQALAAVANLHLAAGEPRLSPQSGSTTTPATSSSGTWWWMGRSSSAGTSSPE